MKMKPSLWTFLLLLVGLLLGACSQVPQSAEPLLTDDTTPQESSVEIVERASLQGTTQDVQRVDAQGVAQQGQLSDIGEWGKVNVQQANPDDWDKVELKNSYSNPVVIVQPLSANGGDPATVRLRNVSSRSFELQIDEWDYLDGAHTQESVSYLVFESGRHQLSDGLEIKAGKTSASSNGWRTVTFGSAFSRTPVIFSQTQSLNETDAVVTRQSNPTSKGFRVRLQEQEASTGGHKSETVGYIAMEQGEGSTSGIRYAVGRTGFDVGSTWYRLNFATTFDREPAFVASIQSFKEADTATLRYQGLTLEQVEVFVEEEQSKDGERGHTKESVGYAAFGLAGTTPTTPKAGVQTARPLGSTTSPYGYYEYLPAGYGESTKAFPVLIFLHGLGERGCGTNECRDEKYDLRNVLRNGPPNLIRDGKWVDLTGDKFIVVSPQASAFTPDFAWDPTTLRQFINHVRSNYRVEERQIYLTGFSLGAFGVWEYLKAYPTNSSIAAAIPVAGKDETGRDLNPNSTLCGAVNVPIWAFHSKEDGVVNFGNALQLIKLINNCRPAPPVKAKFTLYENLEHVPTSEETYSLSGRNLDVDPNYDPFNQSIYAWLLDYQYQQ